MVDYDSETIAQSEAFKDFCGNFAPHCGAPQSVFNGQLSVAVNAALQKAAADARKEAAIEACKEQCEFCRKGWEFDSLRHIYPYGGYSSEALKCQAIPIRVHFHLTDDDFKES